MIEDCEVGLVGQLGSHHAYNAVLKRRLGKPRATMTLAELEAQIGWLERNRVSEHLGLIQDDHRYRWTAQRRRPKACPTSRRNHART